MPLNTYLLFQHDLSIEISNAAAIFGILFVGLTIGIFAILRVLPLQLYNVAVVVILISIVCSYYNYYFSNYQGKIIGADSDVMNQSHHLYEYIALVGFLAVALFFRRKLANHIMTIVAFILIVNLINVSVLWFQSDSVSNKSIVVDSIDSSFYKLSSKNNIIHLVLDGMQGSVFANLLEEHSELRNSFQGFEFFADTLTASEVTYLAIPAMLSGQAFDGEGSIKEYRQNSGMLMFDNNKGSSAPPLLSHLKQAGYSVDILTAPGSGMKELPPYTHFYNTDFETNDATSMGINRLVDLVLIKMLPWQGKRIVYKNGAWFFSRNKMVDLPRANRAMAYLEDFGNNIQLNEQLNTYKLIHLLTPHRPYTTSQDCLSQIAESGSQAAFNQARCTMLAVVKFLDQLKLKDVYDNSLIIINGDHGNCVDYNMPITENESLPNCIGNSNPLLLIKRPNKNSDLSINDKQVELTDIPSTVLQTLKIPNKLPGESVFEKSAEINKTRTFTRFKPNRIIASKLDRVDVIERFQVKGNLYDAKSWKKVIIDKSLNIDEFSEGLVLDIDKTGKSGSAAWIRWNGEKPSDNIFIINGDERILVKIGNGFLSFKFPNLSSDGKIFIIDPVKKLKQQVQIE